MANTLWRRLGRLWLGLVVLAAAGAGAWAAEPKADISNYQHTAFPLAEGAPAAITAITQGTDGYLWLGTEFGLFRYDGVTFEPVQISPSLPRRSLMVDALAATKSGEIIIGHNWGGITLYSKGRFRDINYPDYTGTVFETALDKEGGAWVASDEYAKTTIARYYNNQWKNYSIPHIKGTLRFCSFVIDQNGAVWVALLNGLYILRPGASTFESLGRLTKGAASLAVAPNGHVWVADDTSLRDLDPHADAQAARGWPQFRGSNGLRAAMRFDASGTLWDAGAPTAVMRITGLPSTAGSVRAPARVHADIFMRERLTSPSVMSAFFDHEGNIWLGTKSGLDRFRKVSIATNANGATWGASNRPAKSSASLSLFEGFGLLSTGRSIYAMAGSEFFKVVDGLVQTRRPIGDSSDSYLPCTSKDGGLWYPRHGRLVQVETGRAAPSLPDDGAPLFQCSDDPAGRLWVETRKGLYERVPGGWRSVVLDPSSPNPLPMLLSQTGDGALLAYIGNGGLYRVAGDRVDMVWPRRDISIGLLNLMARGTDGVLIGGERGLARWKAGRIQALSDQNYDFLRNVTGIVAKPDVTWLLTMSGLVRLSTRDLETAFDHPGTRLTPHIFGAEDGLAGFGEALWENTLAEDGQGRLLIATNQGFSVLDVNHLSTSRLPPPVVIKSLIAEHTIYLPSPNLVLPKGLSKLEIDYTAPNFTAPGRVAFRYRLTGVDKEWVDPGGRRQAVYTNLAPGRYHFQVIAANKDGAWNTTGASVDFEIPPTFMQSNLFLVACIAAAGLLLWFVYSLQLRQVTSRMQVRLEERLRERERIARELHDTLLQGVQGLVLRFQVVADRLPPGQPAHELMTQALDRADDVLAEGRDRVRDLRSRSTFADLHQALGAAVERLLIDAGIDAELTIEGVARRLHAVAVDEIVKVAEEAMFNLARHACAKHAKVTIRYEPGRLELKVWDDGVGIDPAILKAGGREGHYGLTGMRERAAKLRAALNIASQTGHGSTITLKVPASVAYADTAGRRWRLWRRAGSVFARA